MWRLSQYMCVCMWRAVCQGRSKHHPLSWFQAEWFPPLHPYLSSTLKSAFSILKKIKVFQKKTKTTHHKIKRKLLFWYLFYFLILFATTWVSTSKSLTTAWCSLKYISLSTNSSLAAENFWHRQKILFEKPGKLGQVLSSVLANPYCCYTNLASWSTGQL